MGQRSEQRFANKSSCRLWYTGYSEKPGNVHAKSMGPGSKDYRSQPKDKSDEVCNAGKFSIHTKDFFKVSFKCNDGSEYAIAFAYYGKSNHCLSADRRKRFAFSRFSGAFRRVIRPNGKLAKKLNSDGKLTYNDLVNQINDGVVTASPPKIIPEGLPDIKELSSQVLPNKISDLFFWLLKNLKLTFIVLLILLLLLTFITGAYFLFIGLMAAAVAGYIAASKYSTKRQIGQTAAEALDDPKKEEGLVKDIPPQPDFTLTLGDEATTPGPTTTTPGADSKEAANFRFALVDFTKRMALQQADAVFLPLNLVNAFNKVSAAIPVSY